MQIYYDKDADLSLIKGKTVTIIGYEAQQGHAHALKYTCVIPLSVIVGLRPGSSSAIKAEQAGLAVKPVGEAAAPPRRCGDDPRPGRAPEPNLPRHRTATEKRRRAGLRHGFNIHSAASCRVPIGH